MVEQSEPAESVDSTLVERAYVEGRDATRLLFGRDQIVLTGGTSCFSRQISLHDS